MTFVLLALGIAMLVGGGDLLVRSASRLARAWGLSPLVVGLTVVAFGTSAPELAASLAGALAGAPGIALGNVLGSNVANVGLILGLAAVVAPLRTDARFLRREMPILAGASALLVLLAADGAIGRAEGLLLVLLLGGYLRLLLRGDGPPAVEEAFETTCGGRTEAPARHAALVAVGGLGLLVVGARLLVTSASELARGAGAPEIVVGVTVVAVGTSLPELAASVAAAARNEPDLALGNVVGSNVFNVLAILGLTVLVRPIEMPYAVVAPDLWAALLAALLPWALLLLAGGRLGRVGGVVLVVLYVAYVAWRVAA